MSGERLYVDLAALHQGGVNIEELSVQARLVVNRIRQAASTYQFAGGTGEMGEKYQENYKPGEEKALVFLRLLEEAVGSAGDDTLVVARHFEQVNDDAAGNTPQQ